MSIIVDDMEGLKEALEFNQKIKSYLRANLKVELMRSWGQGGVRVSILLDGEEISTSDVRINT